MDLRIQIQVNSSGRLYAPKGLEGAPTNISKLPDKGTGGFERIIASLTETSDTITIKFRNSPEILEYESRDKRTSEMIKELDQHAGSREKLNGTKVFAHRIPYGTLPKDDLTKRFGGYATD